MMPLNLKNDVPVPSIDLITEGVTPWVSRVGIVVVVFVVILFAIVIGGK